MQRRSCDSGSVAVHIECALHAAARSCSLGVGSCRAPLDVANVEWEGAVRAYNKKAVNRLESRTAIAQQHHI